MFNMCIVYMWWILLFYRWYYILKEMLLKWKKEHNCESTFEAICTV